ncbi:MAG: hypothetical protein KAG97_05050 [Victivallales bacterium]|nr:hypothetical protein [Victivallales bacterium]
MNGKHTLLRKLHELDANTKFSSHRNEILSNAAIKIQNPKKSNAFSMLSWEI